MSFNSDVFLHKPEVYMMSLEPERSPVERILFVSPSTGNRQETQAGESSSAGLFLLPVSRISFVSKKEDEIERDVSLFCRQVCLKDFFLKGVLIAASLHHSGNPSPLSNATDIDFRWFVDNLPGGKNNSAVLFIYILFPGRVGRVVRTHSSCCKL